MPDIEEGEAMWVRVGRYWSSSLYISLPFQAYQMVLEKYSVDVYDWFRGSSAFIRPVCP